MMAQKKVFDFGSVFNVESELKISHMGILDYEGAREAFLLGEMIRENPWLTETKKIEIAPPLKPAEKTEPPPGKRKIIL